MNKVKLTAPGQIKPGCKIYFTYLGRPQSYRAYRVEEVLNAGTDKEEILINKRNNLYFITSMAIDGSSWAKDVHLEATPVTAVERDRLKEINAELVNALVRYLNCDPARDVEGDTPAQQARAAIAKATKDQ